MDNFTTGRKRPGFMRDFKKTEEHNEAGETVISFGHVPRPDDPYVVYKDYEKRKKEYMEAA